jgi:hypothetical protein
MVLTTRTAMGLCIGLGCLHFRSRRRWCRLGTCLQVHYMQPFEDKVIGTRCTIQAIHLLKN